MRRKLREIRNKEEGFTLVELLAVIAILAIIIAIAVPSIGSVVSNSKTSAEKAEIQLIEDAGRLYLVDKTEKTVDVSILLKEGYIEARDSKHMDTYKDGYKVVKIGDATASTELKYQLQDKEGEAVTEAPTS